MFCGSSEERERAVFWLLLLLLLAKWALKGVDVHVGTWRVCECTYSASSTATGAAGSPFSLCFVRRVVFGIANWLFAFVFCCAVT